MVQNKPPTPKQTLKQRFVAALEAGELGCQEAQGLVVTLKDFKAYFSDITTDYVNSFLPAATLEPEQRQISHTKFLFRLQKGVYLVHEALLKKTADV